MEDNNNTNPTNLGEPCTQVDVDKLSREDILRLIGHKSSRVSYVSKESTRNKSEAWKKFQAVLVDGKPASYVKCQDCNTIYRSPGKIGTTNLLQHKCSDVTASGLIRGANKTQSPAKDSRQAKITSFTSKTVPNHCIDDLNEIIVTGLAKDLRPLRTVEGTGFVHIAQALIEFGAIHGMQDVKNVLRHRTTLKTKYLPSVVTKTEARLRAMLKTTSSFPKVSFTTDMWSDKYQQRDFLSLSVHFIDDNWKIKCHMLGVEEFDPVQTKTTTNVRNQVHEILTKYLNPDEVIAVINNSYGVTDGGSNMIGVFQRRFPCMCHRLNLVIQWTFNQGTIPTQSTVNEMASKGKPINLKKLFNLQTNCPQIKDVLIDLKKLVEYFKRSGLNKNLATTLKQDVETRWNSQLIMLKSYAVSKAEISDILYKQKKLDKKARIIDDVVDGLIAFLTPFKECSDILSGDKFPTFHLIAIWFHKLLEHIKHNEADSEEMKLLKKQAKICFKEYWNLDPIHYAACLLDPRYRKLKFAPQEAKQAAVDLLEEFMNEEQRSPPLSSTSTENPPFSKKSKYSELEDSDDEVSEATEMEQYLTFKLPARDETFDILEFWSTEFVRTQFPNLQKVAKWILAIPASQASDERVFSTTGSTLGPRRTQLSGSTLSQLTLIHSNTK